MKQSEPKHKEQSKTSGLLVWNSRKWHVSHISHSPTVTFKNWRICMITHFTPMSTHNRTDNRKNDSFKVLKQHYLAHYGTNAEDKIP
jgi:hypothetical protein